MKPFEIPDEKLEVLDEDLQAVLKDMNQHYFNQAKSLRDANAEREAQLEAERAHQQEMEEAVRFDNAVQALGDEWSEVFGSGAGFDLARNGKRDPVAMTNANHRVMLYDTVKSVREVNAKQGGQPMTLQQEINFALMQRYPEKFQQSISGDSTSSGKSKPRSSRSISRPKQRVSPTSKSKDDDTVAAVNRMLRKKGRPPLSESPEAELSGEI